MAATAGRLSETAVAVLEMIASGHTYEQILAVQPTLTYFDMFNAAREALAVANGLRDSHQERLAEIRRQHHRAYESWAADDGATLQRLVDEGVPVASIAAALRRQPSAIRSRMVRLGLRT